MACPGFTDSHFLRQAFETTAYGYFPLRTMDSELAATLIHSANERIRSTTSSSVSTCFASSLRPWPRDDRVADALVVFGITGDLARRSTLPALYSSRSRASSRAP